MTTEIGLWMNKRTVNQFKGQQILSLFHQNFPSSFFFLNRFAKLPTERTKHFMYTTNRHARIFLSVSYYYFNARKSAGPLQQHYIKPDRSPTPPAR